MDDVTTIGALATAPSPSGLAVIRVSGPRTKVALRSLFRSKKSPVDDPRRLVFGDLVDFESGDVIDKSLAVFMPGPNSYTGEDIGEFQFHGSPLLVEKILRSLFAFGISPAEPGEFTKRAFINGKIDLVQAEAISSLINATSDAALKIAGEQLKGRFSAVVAQIGEPLRDALAEVEASLDFPEEPIDAQTTDALRQDLSKAQERLEELIDSYSYGQVIREGFRVLLCGPPNSGKSSLLNLMLGVPRAIVSDVSGTTRDLLEEQLELQGHRFVLCDSAGLHESDDTVERMGIELAKERIVWADLVLLVADASDEARGWEKVLPLLQKQAKKIWLVVNKIDLNPKAIGTIVCDSRVCAQNFYLSARTRDGFTALQDALVEEVRNRLPAGSEESLIVVNERHRDCLARAVRALEQAKDGTSKHPLEIVAADIRAALNALEELVGRTYTEDILSRIFSKFCIGK